MGRASGGRNLIRHHFADLNLDAEHFTRSSFGRNFFRRQFGDWRECMHAGESYRLSTDTVAIDSGDGRTIIDLPRGAIVTVTDGSPDYRWFVNVIWEEKIVSMFKTDLQDLGTLVGYTFEASRSHIQRSWKWSA